MDYYKPEAGIKSLCIYTGKIFIDKSFDDDNDNGGLDNHLNQTSFPHDSYSEME